MEDGSEIILWKECREEEMFNRIGKEDRGWLLYIIQTEVSRVGEGLQHIITGSLIIH